MPEPHASQPPAKSAILLLPEGFEEMEAVAPVDILRRAAIKVTVAALDSTEPVTGRNGIRWLPDCQFSAVSHLSFDALILPGGPGHVHLLQSQAVLDFVRHHCTAGRLTAAICAAPIVLHHLGLLDGFRFTCHHSLADALPQRIADAPVVHDQNRLTSQGAGTAHLFALAIVSALIDADTAQRIAQSISL